MARDTTDNRPIETHAQLLEWLTKGNKPKDEWRIGTEHEKFGFYLDSLKPVPYEGENGIRAILQDVPLKSSQYLNSCFGANHILERYLILELI